MLILLFLSLFGTSCKEEDPKPKTTLTLLISENNKDEEISYDSIVFQNMIGNRYSITRLQYFISNLQFHQKQVGWIFQEGVIYCDGRQSHEPIEFNDLPQAEYDSIAFTFGLNENDNRTGGLPANTENLNMAWPVPMGGGYHFLKMEGHHINMESKKVGYALHVGTNIDRGDIKQEVFFDLSRDQTIALVMDSDEWFQHPNALDLNNISYTMGNDTMMLKVLQNALSVFKLEVR